MRKPYKEGCHGVWLSECCGAESIASDVAEDNRAGICGGCKDFTGFEPGEHDRRCIGTDPAYGADADGNRGIILRDWECRECGELTSITGE